MASADRVSASVPEVALPQRVQVLRRPGGARIRTRHHRGGRSQRERQVQRGGRRGLGARAPRVPARCVRPRWRTSSSWVRPTGRRWAGPRSTLTIDNSAGKLATDLAEITITRTLFRSGDSEYSINGAPCRLLDIQELLSDTGVGRQQHVIISQGHLDAILEARPEDRRAVIEEAAGVLKFRRRRERSERRLASTEENLERLFDLVREVKRQIRPLERQAAAARSYTGLSDELRAVRLYVAGSELRALDQRHAQGALAQAELTDHRGTAPGLAHPAGRRHRAHGGRDVGPAGVRPGFGAGADRGHGGAGPRPVRRAPRAAALPGPGPRRRRRCRRGLHAGGRGRPPGRRAAGHRGRGGHPGPRAGRGGRRRGGGRRPSSRSTWTPGGTGPSCDRPRRR